MKRILCATDLSPRCEGAVHRAGMLAQQYGAQLALLHVLDPVLLLEPEQEHVIARLRSQAAPHVMGHWISLDAGDSIAPP